MRKTPCSTETIFPNKNRLAVNHGSGRNALALLLCLLALGTAFGQTAPSFFVATNGNDSWSGLAAEPNAAGTDGPFATLAHALIAARQQRQHAPATQSSVAVQLRSGIFFQSEPLVLTPADSGLAIEAYGAERPIVSGGRRIAGWKSTSLLGHTVWVADVPRVGAKRWNFCELWVNGRRADRARHPAHGYLKVAEVPEAGSDWTKGQMQFRFQPGDLQNWPTITNAEVVVMSRWVESRLPVFSVDEKEHLVRFSKKSVFQLAKGDVYYAEGALEFLQEPGSWYLDSLADRIYYLPREGEALGGVDAIAPVLSQVLRIEGDPKSGRFVENVTFRGLTFSHTEWYFPEGFASAESAPTVWPPPNPTVGGFAQAAVGVPGAVWGRGLHQCRFDDCRFVNIGDYGLELTGGCVSNVIAGCEFAELGAGGVKLGETAIRTELNEQTGANEISDCSIEDGGKLFHSAIGIWIGQSPGNRLLHNLIHDFYYTGISIGWTWGYGPALATNNLVAFNHVHHIGVKSNGDGPILSDMGGIYTLGMQPGTRICNNLWHDIAGREYGGWGIYFDEGSSGIVAQSNVVYRTTHGGFHQHYGATNMVRNNIFAFAREQQLQRTRPEPHRSFSFITNIVYFDTGVLLGGNWSNDHYLMDWNVYFDARPGAKPEQMRFAGDDLQQWRARGHDVHSIIADPLFVAPERYDFRLQNNSPARQLGFDPIDVSNVGPTHGSSADWVVYQGHGGPGHGKHVVLISGDEEYRSEESLPMLAKILAVRHGFDCTVLFSINPVDHTIDPTILTNIPGMEALDSADLCIMALRFRDLPDSQMKHFVDYLHAGKPLIALRTSTHAFQYPPDSTSPYTRFDWRNPVWPGGFGQQILGETWVSHHGEHGKESTRGIINPAFTSDPILRGISDLWCPTDVYTVAHLPADARVLVRGEVLSGMNPADPPLAGPKNDPLMPLVWTREYRLDQGRAGQAVVTTMGAAVDLQNQDLRRLLVNACYWTTGLGSQIPTKADVDYVGEYHPTWFGFGKFVKGVRPSDLRLWKPNGN